MSDIKYNLVINKGKGNGFDLLSLNKKDFLRESAKLLNRPKKIFLGLGDFLEIGDYSKLMDSLFYDMGGSLFENTLDNINRIISDVGDVPASFLKLAVYYPDFLLKDVPTFCVSVIGRKSRLFPGAKIFVQFIKEYDPLILTAMPYEISIEFARRMGLDDNNLVSTKYKISQNKKNKNIYAGDIKSFISGNRKVIEIEKSMIKNDLKENDIIYIGRGEAGTKTFSRVSSISMNPSKQIISESKINIYGSSLESLLVLFNYNNEIESFLMSSQMEEFLPSLIVFSDYNHKDDELINLELENRHKQNHILSQRIVHSGDSYQSVEREIDIVFGGAPIDFNNIKSMINERMEMYSKNQQEFVNKIFGIAKDRYINFYTVK